MNHYSKAAITFYRRADGAVFLFAFDLLELDGVAAPGAV
jgi:hypothetical protein